MIDFCKSCVIAREEFLASSQHFLIEKNIYCPLCKQTTSSIWHTETSNTIGDSYECSVCHNYILYTENDCFYKEEFYFQDYFLIRSHDLSVLYKDRYNKVFEITEVIDNNQIELSKLKRLIPFV